MPMVFGIQLLQCVLQLMFISRPIFQSCICLERYLAVVHPTVFLRFKPLRYRLACCMVEWLLMLLYCIIPTFTLSVIHVLYLLVSMSLFFLVLMLYCSVHVLCVLKQPGPGDGSRGHESRNGLKRKAFTIIVITLVFTSISHVLRVFILSPTLLFASQQVVHLSQPVHQHRQRVHHPSAVPPQTWKTAMHGALSR
ncbi:C-X-C chemokine receptor type 3 isoform X1 [Larimichthys crocea]|uniref:C-X-C chemokine receptor type 3 isoform X1 n=1 Tax=Larimichthys crocea TaxID=215358 RepID=UPI000F5F1C0D|nr:C-X-C chemokine receptor type 3 isoform X1 [Larimichthys crocea]XP_027132364.1 C-X-C chemokine receptor type 3 isoform X1 [Larimichthys crocea]